MYGRQNAPTGTITTLQAGKLRFEVNRVALPMGLEASFGVIRHPGAALAVPVLDDGRLVLLRHPHHELPGG